MKRNSFLKKLCTGLFTVPVLLKSADASEIFGEPGPGTMKYFYLDPAKCKCNACEKHAANKRFKTISSVTRAHNRCKCEIRTGLTSEKKYKKWFSEKNVFDLRE